MRSVYQDRLGTDTGNAETKWRFLQGCIAYDDGSSCADWSRCAHWNTLCADDTTTDVTAAGAYYDASFSCSAQCAAAVLPFSESCRYENTSFCDAIVYSKSHRFTKTGSGQT